MNQPHADNSPPVVEGPWWRRNAWVLLALAPYLVLAIWHWPTLPSVDNGDYAQYLLHAKALVEGRPYADIGYLFTPYNSLVSPRQQTPGWPLLLAPGVALFGTGFFFPKVLGLIAGCGFVGSFAVRLARSDDRWIAVGAAAILGVSIEQGFSTNTVLSDLPFAAFVWAWLVIADAQGPVTWRRIVILGLVGTFAILVRVVGVAIVPAVVILAFTRRGSDRVRLLTLAGVWVALGIAAVLIIGPGRVPFLLHALRDPVLVLGRLGGAWGNYMFGPLHAIMYPFPWSLANDLYHGGGLVLMAVGLYDVIVRLGKSAVGGFALSYAGLLGIAPTSDIRYLWPLWPLLAYAMLAGARRVLSLPPFRARRFERALPVATAMLVVVGCIVTLRMPAPPALLSRDDVRELFAWLRTEKSQREVRVVFSRARVLTLETGVPAMPTFRASPEATYRELDRARITHVIAGDAGVAHPATAPFEAFVRSHPESFVPAWSNAGFTVFRYLGSADQSKG
jgi:hypothetical protein